jgi:hypothetical protein
MKQQECKTKDVKLHYLYYIASKNTTRLMIINFLLAFPNVSKLNLKLF